MLTHELFREDKFRFSNQQHLSHRFVCRFLFPGIHRFFIFFQKTLLFCSVVLLEFTILHGQIVCRSSFQVLGREGTIGALYSHFLSIHEEHELLPVHSQYIWPGFVQSSPQFKITAIDFRGTNNFFLGCQQECFAVFGTFHVSPNREGVLLCTGTPDTQQHDKNNPYFHYSSPSKILPVKSSFHPFSKLALDLSNESSFKRFSKADCISCACDMFVSSNR